MGSNQQFSLHWNDYVRHITNAFDTLRNSEDLVDVTLSCEGKHIRAHKMLLSACSTYFKELFKENPCQHPVIIFRNVKLEDLSALVDFMYQGEVNVNQDRLSSFLTTAELLAVQGLSGGNDKTGEVEENEVEEQPLSPLVAEEPNLEPSSVPWQKQDKQPTPTAGWQKQDSEHTPAAGWRKQDGQHTPSAGTSITSPATYFLEQHSSESPPASKRHKRRSNTPEKQLQRETRLAAAIEQDCDSDPIEIIDPIVQADVKMETVDFDEGGAHDNGGYSDSNLELRDVTKTEKDELQAVGQLLGHDLSEMYSNNSRDSSLQHPTDNMSLDIGQILQKPGPSSGDTQDSLQGNNLLRKTMTMNAKHKSVSKGPRLFCCELCSKTFKHPHSLRLHHKTHTGETQCPVCNVVMSRTYELRVHMRKQHGLTV